MSITNIYKGDVERSDIQKIYKGTTLLYEVEPQQGYTLTSNFTAQSTSGHNTRCYIYETDDDPSSTSFNFYTKATLVDSLVVNDGTFVSGTKTYQITKQYVIICYDGNYGITPYINITSYTNCTINSQAIWWQNGYHGRIFSNFTGNPTITWEAGDDD